jgi:hypothetical protein
VEQMVSPAYDKTLYGVHEHEDKPTNMINKSSLKVGDDSKRNSLFEWHIPPRTPPSPISSLSSVTSSIATSPNATTISSHGSSFPHSLNLASETSSVLGCDESGSPHRGKHSSIKRHQQPKDLSQFKLLESELPKFISKSGVYKANVLRLTLLPFLRQHREESSTSDNIELRIRVLQKWWSSILLTFRERSISNSDRSAYLEGLSGLLARLEWRQCLPVYSELLYDTVRLVIRKLCLNIVPLSVAAFSGKVLAYAYFWAPGVAAVLIYLLAVPQSDIDRIIAASFPSDELCSLEEAINLITDTCSFPAHLSNLIGYGEGKKSRMDSRPTPPPPPRLESMYGPWSRRWASSNSDVFIAFLKHFYSIISTFLPRDLPWNTHLACPGLIVMNSFLLGSLDFVVHPKDRVR